MTLEEKNKYIDSIMNQVVKTLSKIPMNGDTLNWECEIDNDYRGTRFIEESNQFDVMVHNELLKIGGEDDCDDNDRTLQKNLYKYLHEELEKLNVKFYVSQEYVCDYKGYWNFLIKFKD